MESFARPWDEQRAKCVSRPVTRISFHGWRNAPTSTRGDHLAQPAKKSATTKKRAATKKSTPAKKSAATKKRAATTESTTTKKSAPAKKRAPTKKSAATKTAVRPKKRTGPAKQGRMPDRAKSAPASRFFKRSLDRARRIADDPKKLRDIADKANRSSALQTGPFASVLDDFRSLIRLVVAYARGLYREIPLDRLVVVVGGLIYVVSPVDVIPDVIPGAGFLDDATVIAWVIKSVREELDAFREWEIGATD